MICFHPYLFNLIDNTNRRTGFPNEKHELAAGCTENRRAGQQVVPKGGLADCGKGRGRLPERAALRHALFHSPAECAAHWRVL